MPGKSVVSLFCKLKSPAGVAPAGLLHCPQQKSPQGSRAFGAFQPSPINPLGLQPMTSRRPYHGRPPATRLFVIRCKYPPTPHPDKISNRRTRLRGAILAFLCGWAKKAYCAKMALRAHAERIYSEKCRIFITLKNRHAIRFRIIASVQRQGRTPSCAD